MNTEHTKAVPGRVVGINKTSKNIPDTVRITKDTNLNQLITGNNIVIYTDSTISEEMIFKATIVCMAHLPESIVFKGSDWAFQLRVEDIS